MKNWLKKRFALTDQGASDLIKSSIASFACHFANMLPIVLLMIFLDQLLNSNQKSNSFYIYFSITILVIMFMNLFKCNSEQEIDFYNGEKNVIIECIKEIENEFLNE